MSYQVGDCVMYGYKSYKIVSVDEKEQTISITQKRGAEPKIIQKNKVDPCDDSQIFFTTMEYYDVEVFHENKIVVNLSAIEKSKLLPCSTGSFKTLYLHNAGSKFIMIDFDQTTVLCEYICVHGINTKTETIHFPYINSAEQNNHILHVNFNSDHQFLVFTNITLFKNKGIYLIIDKNLRHVRYVNFHTNEVVNLCNVNTEYMCDIKYGNKSDIKFSVLSNIFARYDAFYILDQLKKFKMHGYHMHEYTKIALDNFTKEINL